MKKNIVQDVLPPNKSIRNIELHNRAHHNTVKNDEFATKVNINKQIPKPNFEEKEAPLKIESNFRSNPPYTPTAQYDYDYESPKGKKKWALYLVGVFLVLALAFAISAFFRSAQVKITPMEAVKSLNEGFTARKEASPNNLSFQVVSISKETEKQVDPKDTGGEEKVERKAGGKIVIYNNYSTEVQKLVATTRFQTPEGQVYRIKDPVVVPGKTTKDGKSVPGSVEAFVEADKPGPSYNTGLKDFTVPGFKGDPRFKDVYARSKTEMTGGFSGVQKVISKEALSIAEKEMEGSLKTSLYNDLVNQIPADFVLYPNSLFYKYEPVSQYVNSTGQITIKKKGTGSAVIFDKAGLTKSIQAKVLTESSSDTVRISNLDKLEFSYLSTSTPVSNTTTSVTFILKGEPNFVWVFDESKLKTDLLGLSKKNARVVISSYPSIKEAWILTRPFWNQKIPTDIEKVTLTNTLSDQ